MEKKNLCKTVWIHLENGMTLQTLISREYTDKEIEDMGLNEYFDANIGSSKKEEDLQLCVKVQVFDY